jgi:hypothetical protein
MSDSSEGKARFGGKESDPLRWLCYCDITIEKTASSKQYSLSNVRKVKEKKKP